MRLWHRHRWQIAGPVSIGDKISVAYCVCEKCEDGYARILSGKEIPADSVEMADFLDAWLFEPEVETKILTSS